LAWGVVYRDVPIGILLDRLTEYPEECGAVPETVGECVAYLRASRPNGM
jgi:hypothetical protein